MAYRDTGKGVAGMYSPTGWVIWNYSSIAHARTLNLYIHT